MRSRILVVSRDTAVRAGLARLLGAAGYGVELAEDAVHAGRIGRKGLALALAVAEGPAAARARLLDEVQAAVGPTLPIADPADEAAVLAGVAAALRRRRGRWQRAVA